MKRALSLAAAALATVLAAAVGCGKSTAPSASMPSAGTTGSAHAPAAASSDDGGPAPMDEREAAAWAAAKEGDADELARLADLVGCAGLRERAGEDGLRGTALQAMRFCRDFSELPFLAEVGAKGKDDEARAALDAVVELAARPRRATDPEDADELHVGCGALLDLAKARDRPKERRVLAIRALRMLADRGCVKRGDIPTELDAR